MASKHPADSHAHKAKEMVSELKRLQGWVGKDASKAAELGDVLNALTAHRLLAHQYAAAAADAQEAVLGAAKLVLATGPVGPYTRHEDAERYLTAVVQLAAVQAGLGLHDGACQTMAGALDWAAQLSQFSVSALLTPVTAIWGLSVQARAALAAGDIAGANALADAVLARLDESGLASDEDAGYIALDSERLVSDARWAAGHDGDAILHLQRAARLHEGAVHRLRKPAGMSPVLMDRLAEPLAGLHGDLADRLLVANDVASALHARRGLVDLLSGLAARRPDAFGESAAEATADLADDLRAVGRGAEADILDVATPSGRARAGRARAPRGTGGVSWQPLDDATAFAATTANTGLGAEAAIRAADDERRLAAEQAQAARVDAERLEAERQRAAQIGFAAHEANRAETERRERERVEQSRLDAERVVEDEAAAQRQDAERRAAEEEAARAESQRLREERMAEHRRNAERDEAEREALAGEAARLEVRHSADAELDAAHEAWQAARTVGDRRATRNALEQLVVLLTRRAEVRPREFGQRLVEALDALSGARLRGGDWFGSRAASKQARELARSLGG